MSVVAGSFGVRGKFVRELSDNASRTNANEVEGETGIRDDFSFDMASMNQVASPALQQTFNEAICINSTAFEDTNEDGVLEFMGSKTETALLRFRQGTGMAKLSRSSRSSRGRSNDSVFERIESHGCGHQEAQRQRMESVSQGGQ